MQKQSLGYYLQSSLITFLTGFLTVVLTMVKDLNGDVLDWAIMVGVVLTALRAGIKAVAQYLLPLAADLSKALVNWLKTLFNK